MRMMITTVFLVIALLSTIQTSNADRRSNAFEWAYSYLAVDWNKPEICERISPEAHLEAAFCTGCQIRICITYLLKRIIA